MKSNRKHIILFATALAASLHIQAQETYLNAAVSTQDLNGTARYVGMGGAMDALGADLSTISSNPAGIGLFRSSQAKVSFGFVSQNGGKSFGGAEKTNMSFDQAGFVYAMRVSRRSYVNFAFNYHKSSNFDYILSAAGALNGDASSNKLSYLKAAGGFYELGQNQAGDIWGYEGSSSNVSNLYNATDYLNTNALIAENSTTGGLTYGYNGATGYGFNRAHTGYVGDYEFNVSGNHNDRFYWGVTLGVKDVNYNAYSQYTENLVGHSAGTEAATQVGTVTYTDSRKITGTGFDVKLGFIVRPIEESPFRLGVSVSSPTFYDLQSSYDARIDNNTSVGAYSNGSINDSYKFRLNTPWKFNLSAGTTIGTVAAVGIGYEFADYGSLDTRIKDTQYDSWTDDYYSTSSSDRRMNDATKNTLRGVHTLKLGAELKPTADLALRVGYNYVSPMYRKEAQKAIETNSVSNAYVSTADYTNWEATNRLTLGAGYNFDRLSVDLAYQYSTQSGKFHPFSNLNGETPSDAVKVNNERHQVLLTLGYRF